VHQAQQPRDGHCKAGNMRQLAGFKLPGARPQQAQPAAAARWQAALARLIVARNVSFHSKRFVLKRFLNAGTAGDPLVKTRSKRHVTDWARLTLRVSCSKRNKQQWSLCNALISPPSLIGSLIGNNQLISHCTFWLVTERQKPACWRHSHEHTL
jgi:hypothetical protein